MVNPLNETIEVDTSLNTACRWWVELSHYVDTEDYCHLCHDWEFDCGAETAEEAIDTLYRLVLECYGDY